MEQNNPVTSPAPASTPTPAPTPAPVASTSLPKMEGPVSILKFAWDLFTKNWGTLIPVAIVPSVFGYIGSLFMLSPGNVFFSVIGVLISIAGAILSIAAIPALINAVHQVSTQPGSVLPLKDQYRFGFGYFWSVLLIGLIAVLVGIGATVLFIIPGIIVGIYISFYSYALAIDGKKGFSALLESYDLVRGRWLAVFGRALFIGIAVIIPWLIIVSIMAALGLNGEDSQYALSGLINIIGSAVLTPLMVASSYRMYTGLKALRQPAISTKKFKNWLVAFMSISIIGIVAASILVPVFVVKALSYVKTNVESARLNAESSSVELQRIMEGSQATSTPNN